MNPFTPPAEYVQTQSAVDGITIYMPRPPDEQHQEVVDFRCPQCDGAKAFSTDNGALTCSFCGYHEAAAQEVVGRTAEQFEFTVETMERATQGWGTERKELVCDRCSAHTTIPTDMLTHTCPFCGSNQVVQIKAPQDVLRPRFLLPFSVSGDVCRTNTAVWLGSSWMTPRDLTRLAHGTDFNPIYLPAWTFDAQTSADWRAEVGHTRTRTTGSGKNRRTTTYTEWRWESGHVNLDFDDLLVNGASTLSQKLLQEAANFNLDSLVAYEPALLAGIRAQAYDVPLDAAWEKARQRMRERTKSACRSQASTGQIRNFSMNLDFSHESWRYVLLPIYIATYRYNHKPYQLLVNGQTGKVAGQRPVAWRRVTAVFGLSLLPALVAALVAALLVLYGNADLGSMALLAAGGLFAVALIFIIITIIQATKLDDA
jgi:hypothetical protein